MKNKNKTPNLVVSAPVSTFAEHDALVMRIKNAIKDGQKILVVGLKPNQTPDLQTKQIVFWSSCDPKACKTQNVPNNTAVVIGTEFGRHAYFDGIKTSAQKVGAYYLDKRLSPGQIRTVLEAALT